MSTVFRDADSQPIDSYFQGDDDVSCAVCGRRADAVWLTSRQDVAFLGICWTCSLDVLPALCADAMRFRGRTAKTYLDYKRRLLEKFHEAAALALANSPETPAERAFREQQEDEAIRFGLEQETSD